MSNQLIKSENRQIAKSGENVLEALRKTWGQREITRKATGIKDGHPAIVEKTFIVDSSNLRLNKEALQQIEDGGVNLFHHFAEMIKPEDEERITAIVQSGCFEVTKAIQAFEIAPMIATDRKIKPVTWDQAAALNSPSLATLVKYKGEEKAEALIYMMTFSFAKKFGRRNDLDESQIKELAADIVVQYRNISIADLKMIFTTTLRASKKMFNLDYQGIMAVLEESRQDKMEHATRKAIDTHNQLTTKEKSYRERPKVKDGISGEGLSIPQQIKQSEVMAAYEADQARARKQNANA